MTGSAADPPEFQPHLHTKDVRKDLKARAKDPDDPLELVIVRDMWLTGFDAPSMHTMYVDKTDAGRRAHAGHRPGQPHLPRQARWPDRRLHRRLREPAEGARRVLAERPRPGRRADRRDRRRDAGEARHRPRPAARLRLRLVTRPAGRPSDSRSTPRCSTSSWPTPTAPSASSTRCSRSPRRSRCAARATRRRPSATTSGCSPTCARPS